MARRVFFSFHFDDDHWRVQQVRNIKALEAQPLYTASAWEAVERQGDAAIARWIDENMSGKSCVIVLVGANTASRRWVRYELEKGWRDGKGVLGIRIHGLLDSAHRTSTPGENPMSKVLLPGTQRTLAEIAPLKTPAGSGSTDMYANIVDNIEAWIEEAIRVRAEH